MEDLSIFSHLLIYLIIYLYHYGLIEIYFVLWAIIQYSIIYFIAQIISALAIWNSFSWHLDSFALLWDSPLLCIFLFCFCFLAFSYFWHHGYSRLILYISCLSPSISHFFNKPWFLLLENSIKNQDLSSRYTCCILTSVYIRTYKYFYM